MTKSAIYKQKANYCRFGVGFSNRNSSIQVKQAIFVLYKLRIQSVNDSPDDKTRGKLRKSPSRGTHVD